MKLSSETQGSFNCAAHDIKIGSNAHVEGNCRNKESLDSLFPSTWVNAQGLALYYRSWLPPDCEVAAPDSGGGGGGGALPAGVVFIAHGVNEHSGRYEHVAAALTKKLGVAVFCVDHQGHGASEGERAHVECFDDFASDVLAHATAVLRARGEAWRRLPCFLLGHSMGGAIALQAAMRTAATGGAGAGAGAGACALPVWRGVAVSGPLLAIDPKVGSPLMKGIAHVLGRIFPKFGVCAIDSKLVSRDPAVVEAYDNDPLVYHGVNSAGLGLGMLQAVDQLQADAESFTYPLLIMHGSADKLCAPQGSDDFFRKASSADKTIKHYDELFHEIFNEPEREDVLQDLLDWMQHRLRSVGPDAHVG